MSPTPFDHPVLSALLGDPKAAAVFSAEAELRAMLDFESALAMAEAAEGVIPGEAAEAIEVACAGFVPNLGLLAAATRRDGMVVPELVRMLRAAVGEPHGTHVHVGATSQDVIDTGLVLRLEPLLKDMDGRLAAVADAVAALRAAHGDVPLSGRTRMRRALPMTLATRLDGWHGPLVTHRDRLAELRPRLLRLQFGGPIGTREKLGDKGPAVAARLAEALGLGPADPVWHVTRDGIAELASWLSLVSGGLGKIGQDVALMAQDEIGEVRLKSGGGSSAMPHKVNPVAAETLVALARFNAGMLGTMHQALVHEQERSGAAWTLEWMCLPQMAVATAAGLRLAGELLGDLDFSGS